MAAPAKRIELGDEERAALARVVRAGTSERRMVERAQIVLLASEGRSARQIAGSVGCALNTAKKWRGRFEAGGLVASLRRELIRSEFQAGARRRAKERKIRRPALAGDRALA